MGQPNQPPNDEPWVPRTRDDWVSMFSDGMEKHRTERAEAEAKEAAEAAKNAPDPEPPAKRTVAERLLGGGK